MDKVSCKRAFLSGITASTLIIASSASALELDIWGVAHLSADQADKGATTSEFIASNSSRLAFSGSHKLNDDVAIVFQYESGVDLTGEGSNDGNGGAGSDGQLFTRTRDAFVGLQGDFGKVLAGRQGALNQWVYDFNLFADQVGDLGNFWGHTGLPGRADSALAYVSPDFSGVDFQVTYVPEEETKDTDIQVLKINYAGGGLKVSGGYINAGQGVGSEDHSAAAIIASYDLGQFTIGGGFQSESDAGGVSGDDADTFTLGGSMKLGEKGLLKAQYFDLDADAAGEDADGWAIGYDYAMDDNTTLYVAYAANDNDPGASVSANNYGHGDNVGSILGGEPEAISFGLVYKFRANLIKN